VSFAAITLCVASQRVFIVVISLSTQSGNFWIYPRSPGPQLVVMALCLIKARDFVKGTTLYLSVTLGIVPDVLLVYPVSYQFPYRSLPFTHNVSNFFLK
jgi:hypothetical protein